METDLQGFHEDEQFSTNLLSTDEVMKYQLQILESKPEDNILWQEESVMNENAVEREDFQQIMSDWQNHVGLLQISEPEDVDVPLDSLNSSDILLDERSPILSKTLHNSVQKLGNIVQLTPGMLGIRKQEKKEPVFENEPCSVYQKSQNEQNYFNENPYSEMLGIKKETIFKNSSCELYPKISQDQKCLIENPVYVMSGIKKESVFENEPCPVYKKSQNEQNYFNENPYSEMLGIKKETIFENGSCELFPKIPQDQKCLNGNPVFVMSGIKKEPIFENSTSTLHQKIQNDKNYFNGNPKSEPTVVRKLTLLNGDKEILGKNIIGLHSLNVIKENPDQNCQVTSTIINGKKYKIIIKPKSQKLQKYNEEKIKKSLIKKLSKCNFFPKTEPKEDELISEMRNGNYDVPILGNDTLLSWDMAWFDNTWDNTSDNLLSDINTENSVEPPKKVPPLKIKIQKSKKCKKKRIQVKSDEEIDVETVGDKVEDQSVEIRNVEESSKVKANKGEKTMSENIKDNMPKEIVDETESLKRKKDGRIPLVQVIPKRKNVRGGTRMQDAAAAINRNKLLKIVSGGDTVQLDHDYCSTFKNFGAPQIKKSDPEVNLTEKNPKKDSGMESGDVSDASEDPQTPENFSNLHSFQQINNKLIEQRKSGKTNSVTKVAADLFRVANVITSNTNVNNSDVVKTLVVSNGNKALTNDGSTSTTCKDNGDKCDIVPSGSSEISNSSHVNSKTEVKSDSSKVSFNNESGLVTQLERPKKKLKLEEYLSRRNGKIAENRTDSNANNERNTIIENKISFVNGIKEGNKTEENTVPESTETKEMKREKEENKEEKNCEDMKRGSYKGRKSRRYRSQRSPSTSSGERDSRRDRERSPGSRSSWRGTRRDYRSRHRYRNSSSSERRRSFWSRSLSRSSSRESSSSSDRSGGRRRKFSPMGYRRRSGSRSISRERSRSRNRSYSDRRHQNRYYNRDFYSRRSRSPYRGYSIREKQRQIEERRVVYIGRIEEGMTNAKLRERFSIFGPIVDISLHFREYGDNYGFVTYAYKDDAYDAVEHGNDDPSLPRYDLCFGGRRGFCKERYADLDGMPTSYSGFQDRQILQSPKESFDLLLKKAQAKLKKRINKNNKES